LTTDRSQYPTSRRRLSELVADADYADLTPSERVALVWPLTLQARAFKEPLDGKPRLRRDVVRVIRPGR
jgi:hypothetical protein